MERELSKDIFIPADIDDVYGAKGRAPGFRVVDGYRGKGRTSAFRLLELGAFNIIILLVLATLLNQCSVHYPNSCRQS